MPESNGGEFGSCSERELPEDVQELDSDAVRDLLSALDLSHICVRHPDGTIRFWAHGNEQLYGWTRAEAVGRISHDLLKTRFPKPLAEINEDLLRHGTWNGELRHVTKSGNELWVVSNWALRRDKAGRPLSVIEVNNDVTEQKRGADAAHYLACIVDASSDAIIGKNLDGIITSWNSGAARLFGYSAEEIVGKSILKLFPPELTHEESVIQARLRRGERVEHLETVRVTKSGRRIEVSITSSPIRNEAGKVIGASQIARDITQRNALESAFRESERHRRLATEAGELGLWSYDRVSGKMYWSARCKAIFGLAPGDPIPTYRASLRLVHPKDVRRVRDVLETTAAGGVAFELEFRIVQKTGFVRWVQVRGRPSAEIDPDGEEMQLHGTIFDFTRRKQTEEALKRTNSQLQQFAFAAAHDLQEPLRNIALAISLVTSQSQLKLDPNSAALLDTAAQSAQRMKDMVRGLLAYSRVLHEEDDEVWPVNDANEALEGALGNLALEIRGTNARITHDALPKVKMDRTRLMQLFQNLIGNSIKYRSAAPPRIHVGAIRKQNFWELCISDNGIGIAPQYHDRVFGVFKRLRLTPVSGTGLGLALCKRIVEHYGGEIWIESDGRQGTTFHFTIPSAEYSTENDPRKVRAAGKSPGVS